MERLLGVKVLGTSLFLNFGKSEWTLGTLISPHEKGKTIETQSILEEGQ